MTTPTPTTIFKNFSQAIDYAFTLMRDSGIRVHRGKWQGVDVSKKPDAVTYELHHFNMKVPIYSDFVSGQPNFPGLRITSRNVYRATRSTPAKSGATGHGGNLPISRASIQTQSMILRTNVSLTTPMPNATGPRLLACSQAAFFHPIMTQPMTSQPSTAAFISPTAISTMWSKSCCVTRRRDKRFCRCSSQRHRLSARPQETLLAVLSLHVGQRLSRHFLPAALGRYHPSLQRRHIPHSASPPVDA